MTESIIEVEFTINLTEWFIKRKLSVDRIPAIREILDEFAANVTKLADDTDKRLEELVGKENA